MVQYLLVTRHYQHVNPCHLPMSSVMDKPTKMTLRLLVMKTTVSTACLTLKERQKKEASSPSCCLAAKRYESQDETKIATERTFSKDSRLLDTLDGSVSLFCPSELVS